MMVESVSCVFKLLEQEVFILIRFVSVQLQDIQEHQIQFVKIVGEMVKLLMVRNVQHAKANIQEVFSNKISVYVIQAKAMQARQIHSACNCASEACCQLSNKHYINSACTTCDIAFSLSSWSIQSQNCECVEANGLIGGQNSVCTSCWSSQTVVKNSVCTTCTSIDINAIFIQNQCQCKNSFTLKNNICVKPTNVKQTIGLAVGIPVAAVVVVVVVIVSVLVIKKRQSLKQKSNDSAEIPQQMMQPALQSTITENK
ncbi:Growth_factor receptor cysteine-rich domain superfamily [Hexamita inflata]|uniref:Growth factor receptor cysteine-rich domain superfamily n=1 Tax=Hexamita inflata TaxID=28002 RepID=A0AA86R3V9_9EUKA|nr:Growth factor receptor cysteine-rich domain superfamily [Hexamita inflata]CAI9965374.1 Growth factor receptor cysteine-rich domain superfamily [Hexamita inflata]